MTRIIRRPLRPVLGLIAVFALPCLAANFEREIRPLLKEYCLGCHSTEKHTGDLDLERFTSLSEVMKHPKAWQGVVEQMGLGEMPPKEKPQP
ncbi:MAG TPA: c-type cytochrome domain-containing protein, partial [Verrucomicrobiae bacterium]